MQQDFGNGGGSFVVGLMCGTMVGAALGILFAPKSGSDTRRELSDSSDRLQQKATEVYGQASESLNQIVSKGRKVVRDGKDVYQQARETVADTTARFAAAAGQGRE